MKKEKIDYICLGSILIVTLILIFAIGRWVISERERQEQIDAFCQEQGYDYGYDGMFTSGIECNNYPENTFRRTEFENWTTKEVVKNG